MGWGGVGWVCGRVGVGRGLVCWCVEKVQAWLAGCGPRASWGAAWLSPPARARARPRVFLGPIWAAGGSSGSGERDSSALISLSVVVKPSYHQQNAFDPSAKAPLLETPLPPRRHADPNPCPLSSPRAPSNFDQSTRPPPTMTAPRPAPPRPRDPLGSLKPGLYAKVSLRNARVGGGELMTLRRGRAQAYNRPPFPTRY